MWVYQLLLTGATFSLLLQVFGTGRRAANHKAKRANR